MRPQDDVCEKNPAHTVILVRENQRRTANQNDYSRDQLVDGDLPPFCDSSGDIVATAVSKDMYVIDLPTDTCEWNSEWVMDMNSECTDKEGWQYAAGYDDSEWLSIEQRLCMVRRRFWLRVYRDKSIPFSLQNDGDDGNGEPITIEDVASELLVKFRTHYMEHEAARHAMVKVDADIAGATRRLERKDAAGQMSGSLSGMQRRRSVIGESIAVFRTKRTAGSNLMVMEETLEEEEEEEEEQEQEQEQMQEHEQEEEEEEE